MNAVDWQTVETLVDSERIPIYSAALADAVARRDVLQQSLFEIMDQVAWLRFQLREAVRRTTPTPEPKNPDQLRKSNREAQQRCRARKEAAEAICIE